MAGALDELLDEDAVVAEACQPLALDRFEALAHVALAPARRMPLPPPPADAFIITGKPISDATRTALSVLSISPRKPGTTLTPAAFASFFDWILSPIAAMAFGGGPTKAMPASSQARAKLSRSDRKP